MEPTSPQPVAPSPLQPKSNVLLPISIIVAGLLIGGGLFMGLYLTKSSSPTTASNRPVNQHQEVNLKAVSSADHIRGSINAPVKLIEYSDTDCPFCQAFHPTVNTIYEKHAATGKVAWVYRYFNTGIQSHPHTELEARAAACVAQIGGNDAFWKYIDTLFERKDFTTNPPKFLDPSQLPVIAASYGVDKTKFNECLSSNSTAERVAQDTVDIKKAGGTGTPYSFIVSNAKLSKETQALVSEINDSYVSQFPTAPDVIYVSKDNKIIVVTGNMPLDILDPIVESAVKDNS
jgi:protein-disulfide isomerase